MRRVAATPAAATFVDFVYRAPAAATEVAGVLTANANGTGDVVALSPKFRIETGAANSADAPVITQIHPPLVVAYSATSKAVTMRVQGSDASASATLGMNYWLEDIT
jgi:hypothetical protein